MFYISNKLKWIIKQILLFYREIYHLIAAHRYTIPNRNGHRIKKKMIDKRILHHDINSQKNFQGQIL